MFKQYPDVVSVQQMREMLGGIGRNTAYKLLSDQTIKSKKLGGYILYQKPMSLNF